jgi:phosphatidylethanolamine-binding protein (PEBP) family uncharacterized protein
VAHWAAYDISGKRTYLDENEGRSSGRHKFEQAINDFGRVDAFRSAANHVNAIGNKV